MRSHGPTGIVAVLALDLGRSKEVNDAHGRTMVVVVQKAKASRLTSAVTETNLVARTGSDELVVVVASDRFAGEAAF